MDGLELRLDGRVALVTGASRGIGRGVALGLAGQGAEVVLLGRSRADLEAVAAEIEGGGGRASPLPCDLAEPADLERALFGLERVDVLVNNAGANIPEPFSEVSLEHYERLFNLNVRAAFLCAQHAARRMMARGEGGAIVNVTSQMGHVGAANRSVYCATKHALEGLTKALAVELAPHRIRVNSVAPTFVETPFTEPMFADPAFRGSVLSKIPLGRVGRVEDVVGAAVFLASPAASLITGASLLVDGGWTAQ